MAGRAAVGHRSGAIGAGYCVHSRRNGRVELLSLSGPLVETGKRYADYYHARDPQRALVEAAPRAERRLADCVIYAENGRMGAALEETSADSVVDTGFPEEVVIPLVAPERGFGQVLTEPHTTAQIRRAARLQVELNSLGWKSPIALRALDRLGTAVIVTHGNGRVIELNRSGEHILRQRDGLTVRSGRLEAANVTDNSKLAGYIAAAATTQKTEEAIGRMRIGRHTGRLAYALTVAPLGAELGVFDRPMAMILIGDPDEHTASERDLAEYFGLSPAESRLAVALMAGRRLRDVAIESGLQVTTLRSQISAILRKVGVERQSDLIGVLSRLPFIIPRIIHGAR